MDFTSAELALNPDLAELGVFFGWISSLTRYYLNLFKVALVDWEL
jgi:hypothetical protein